MAVLLLWFYLFRFLYGLCLFSIHTVIKAQQTELLPFGKLLARLTIGSLCVVTYLSFWLFQTMVSGCDFGSDCTMS